MKSLPITRSLCALACTGLLAAQSPLLFSTYFGGGAEDRCYGVARAGDGRIFVAGHGGSADLPVTDGSKRNGGSDAFVACFDPDRRGAAQLLWCVRFGGAGDDQALRMQADPGSNRLTVVGNTTSTDLPVTAGAFQPKHAGPPFDGYLSMLSPELDELRYSTLLGGDFNEPLIAVTADGHGGAITAGASTSYNFPVTGDAFQRTNAGLANACITHLDLLPYGVARQGARTTSNGARSVYRTVTEQPRAAAAKFRVVCEDAPVANPGLALVGAQHDGVIIAGIPVFLDLASWLAPFAVASNGLGSVELPLPASSATQGLKFATQFFWIEQAKLIGSDGLFLTIQ